MQFLACSKGFKQVKVILAWVEVVEHEDPFFKLILQLFSSAFRHKNILSFYELILMVTEACA